MKNNKNCIMCEYWYFDCGSPRYSEYTPGENWSMECEKNIWKAKKNMSTCDFRKLTLMANKCDEYKEVVL